MSTAAAPSAGATLSRRAVRAADRRRGGNYASSLGVAMVAPSLAVFLGLIAVPIMVVGLVSLSRWTGFDIADISWLGIENYRTIAGDEIFWRALRNTLLFTGLTTLFLNVIGFGVALLIATRVRGTGLLRGVIFLPALLPSVLVGLMWQRVLDAFGFVNQILQWLGVADQPIFFLGEERFVLWAIIGVTVWQFAGYDMILYYAGLQGVDRSMLEAAALDGARTPATVFQVIIPSMWHIVGVVALLNVIGGLKIFDVVFVMTRGGPNRSSEVLATYMFEQGFRFSIMGVASAIAVVIVVLAVIASVARFRLAKRLV
ncbi:MAG: sugar ABC transporter permease [bacterium]|nr:sugar ABC transporter permease [bacterium]